MTRRTDFCCFISDESSTPLLRLLCRLHQLRIFVSICCQAFYRLTSCGEHCSRERFTSSQPLSKLAALVLSLFSVSSVSRMRDLCQTNFSVLPVPCRTHPLSHVIIQYRGNMRRANFPIPCYVAIHFQFKVSYPTV